MTLTPARRAVAVLAGTVAVLLLGLLTYLTTIRSRDAAAWVGHTYEVLATLEIAQARAVDAETGVRGYMATGVEHFLDPYQWADRDAARELARLRRLTVDNASQQPRLDTLDARLARVFDHLDSSIVLRRARALTASDMAARLAAGKVQMDAVRRAAGSVSAEERRLLAEREGEDAKLRSVTGWAVLGETLGVASCVVVVGLLLAAAAQAEQRHAEAERAARIEAEEARAEAERANRTRTDFLASMSHELRTPLNAIQGYVQLLSDGLYGPVTEDQQNVLGRLERAQMHLLALVTDVLNFTRLEEGRVTFDVRETRIADVIRDALPLVAPQVAAKALTLTVSLPEDPERGEPAVVVWADQPKLGQVLVNLLSNAVKFTPAQQADGTPGRVSVVVSRRAGTPDVAYLRVHDTGIGIPRDQQDAIFDPFVQVSTGLTRTAEGTGLGLAISRDLTRGMGGHLRVRSAPGEGSAFTVTLAQATTGEATRHTPRPFSGD